MDLIEFQHFKAICDSSLTMFNYESVAKNFEIVFIISLEFIYILNCYKII